MIMEEDAEREKEREFRNSFRGYRILQDFKVIDVILTGIINFYRRDWTTASIVTFTWRPEKFPWEMIEKLFQQMFELILTKF